ncbi:MAG: NAD(P)(+) transhydrogenase (Re/Si-specific) subunit beta [Acidobacteria bacterium]|nr:NAD(P)(+) transhydrogenase (Re/Si-specific) subunit beta [Acidobacteriota bacterium]
MNTALINLAYVVAAALFIFGLKGLASPRTAVRANRMGALGMLIAVVVTLADRQIIAFEWILGGIILGSAVGAMMALKLQMTAIPQMVALLNGFGGVASTLVAGAALVEGIDSGIPPDVPVSVATVASGLIGTVTFWGSLVAFGRLQGILSGRPLLFAGQKSLNAILLLASLGLGVAFVISPGNLALYGGIVVAASLLGILSVMPIGGADMPVVITLLNSYSGLAACATGFVLNNNALIISGSLVGASGVILSRIMCKAMNRSLGNVLFGGVGAVVASKSEADDFYAGKVKSASADEIAMVMEGARRVVIVPGYGMAVAQAQHAVRDLARLLESRGVTVEFGIHPVAGRMPGHMNVLLAEADIPYDKLKDMDEINRSFEQTDVVLVIGANDVVNPLARTDPSSPLAGMPILDVDKARTVVVFKRSLSPGFAGVPNPLFASDRTLMCFNDGKVGVLDLISALKEAA